LKRTLSRKASASGGRTPDKPLAWLHGEIKTPPLSPAARVEAGVLLRRLQRGESLSLPESRPMPSIGPRCHELRIDDTVTKREFRVVYYVGISAIAILEVFAKTTRATPPSVIDQAKKRLRRYQALAERSDP
jgi:phage-related protein